MALPRDYRLLDRPATVRFLKANGNLAGPEDLATVLLPGRTGSFVSVEWDAKGYVRDDGRLDPDALLRALIRDNEAANVRRKQAGLAPVRILGWVQKPRYDARRHLLTWGVRARDKDGPIVNYKSRLLGRHGILSLNLISDPASLQADLRHVPIVLQATAFEPGERYADFRAESDRASALDLSGVILGHASPSKKPKLPDTPPPPSRPWWLPWALWSGVASLLALGLLLIVKAARG